MPKRIPTPPPTDDEPRYLTVVHPYAISGTCNMELPKDREDFARWVACCVDKDAFFAIFHKPSSRGMVIIEINRSYPDFDRVLGEHRWSEFLQNPTAEEAGRVTQVFYCTYSTGRIVQKNGWRRIDVDEAWFKGWSPRNRQIKFPYPKTHFCDVPVEDRTNHALCRPLPGAVITPPPVEIAAPQPVVGSAAWIQERGGGPSLTPIAAESKPKTLGVWGKGAPKLQANSAKQNAIVRKPVSAPQAPSTAARLPAVGGGSLVVKSTNVWQNTGTKPLTTPPVATNWEDEPPVSRQNTPSLPPPTQKNAWESAASYSPSPPGLTVPGQSAASVAQGAPQSATSWGSNGASTSSPDSDSGPATESDNPHAVQVNFSESMEEEFHGMRIGAMEDDGELREFDSIAPNWDGAAAAATWETNPTWDDDPLDAEDLWRQNQKPEAEKPTLCIAHGVICKKGICAEYAKQVRLAKRAKEEDERRAAKAKGKKGGRSKGHSGPKKDGNEPAEKNTTQNNQFRGPGAPVKTNWRGAPRALVSADTVEKQNTTQDVSDDGWGDSGSEREPNAAAVTTAHPLDAASEASWDVSENAFDPWATEKPDAKATHSTAKTQGKKKPVQTNASSSWADQVDAELAAGGNEGAFTTIPPKRKSKRGGGSTTSRGTSNAKSSTSGWGTVSDMPW